MIKPHIILSVACVAILGACVAPQPKADSPNTTSSGQGESSLESSTDTTAKAPRCQLVPAEVKTSLAKGLYPNYSTVTFTDTYGVVVDSDNRNTQGWPGYVVAARVNGEGFSDGDIATWAIRSYDGNISPIYALNKKALQATEWGAAANPGGSAYDQRMKLERSSEAAQATKCAKERKAS